MIPTIEIIHEEPGGPLPWRHSSPPWSGGRAMRLSGSWPPGERSGSRQRTRRGGGRGRARHGWRRTQGPRHPAFPGVGFIAVPELSWHPDLRPGSEVPQPLADVQPALAVRGLSGDVRHHADQLSVLLFHEAMIATGDWQGNREPSNHQRGRRLLVSCWLCAGWTPPERATLHNAHYRHFGGVGCSHWCTILLTGQPARKTNTHMP